MSSVLFSCHNDDAVLFASFLILAHDPHVITVLRSQLQEDRGTGITSEMREDEDVSAMEILGVTLFEQWPEPDSNPDWDAIEAMMRELPSPGTVFAPAVEEGGHDQHNIVGQLALKVFGAEKVVPYLTYRRGYGKSEGEPTYYEPKWIAQKLMALSCYQSQIEEPSTRPWFMGDLHEYLAW